MTVPVRPERTRVIAGVCSGLSESFRIDVTLLRLGFLVLSLAWGIGLLVYLVAWLVMPQPGDQIAGGFRRVARRNLRSVHEDLRSSTERFSNSWQNASRRNGWPLSVSRRWLAVALMVAGAGVVLFSLGAFGWLTPTRALGVAAFAVGAAVLGTVEG